MNSIEAKLEQLGLPLPTPPAAVGSYVPVVRTGSLVVTSGQLPFVGKELAFVGIRRRGVPLASRLAVQGAVLLLGKV